MLLLRNDSLYRTTEMVQGLHRRRGACRKRSPILATTIELREYLKSGRSSGSPLLFSVMSVSNHLSCVVPFVFAFIHILCVGCEMKHALFFACERESLHQQ